MRHVGGLGVAIDDFSRRSLFDQKTEPHPRGEFGIAELLERGHVGNELVAGRARHRENPELAGRVVRRRRVELGEAELRMPGEQRGGLQTRAAIRHVGEVEAELLVELIAEEVRWRAWLIRGVAELALVLLRPGQEFGKGLGRYILV